MALRAMPSNSAFQPAETTDENLNIELAPT
jgi:hypothetical protein